LLIEKLSLDEAPELISELQKKLKVNHCLYVIAGTSWRHRFYYSEKGFKKFLAKNKTLK